MHVAQFGPPVASVRFETLVVLCICVLIPCSPNLLSGWNGRSQVGLRGKNGPRPAGGIRLKTLDQPNGAPGGRSSLKMANVRRACSEPGYNRARCEDLG